MYSFLMHFFTEYIFIEYIFNFYVEDPVGRINSGAVKSDRKTAGIGGSILLVSVTSDVANRAGDRVLTLPVVNTDVRRIERSVNRTVGGGGADGVVGEGVENDPVSNDLVPATEVLSDIEGGDGLGPEAFEIVGLGEFLVHLVDVVGLEFLSRLEVEVVEAAVSGRGGFD